MTSAFPMSASRQIVNDLTSVTAFDNDESRPAAIARRKTQRREMLVVIAFFYLIESSLLMLFAFAGTTAFAISAAYLLCGYAIASATALASEFGLSDRFRDHYLTTPLAGSNALVQFGFLYYAPEVGVVFVCVLFMLFAFATLRIATGEAVFGWVMTTLCLSGILLFTDKMIAFPVSTPAERVVTMLTISLSIGGFLYVGLYGKKMRRVLYERSNELKRANLRIEELAEIDDLTGAFNRRRMMRALDEESVRVQRNGAPFSVALIDLDHFKRINDRFGHPAGDEVLRTFAITMFANIRASDRFGRYGGEEFLLLMPDTPKETAALLLDRLRAIVADTDWSAYSSDLRVTMSAGVAALRLNEAPETLLTRADAALYRSKDAGRNQITTA